MMKSKIYSLVIITAFVIALFILLFREFFVDATTLASGIVTTVIGLVFTIDSVLAIATALRTPNKSWSYWLKTFISILMSILFLLFGANLLAQVATLLK